MDNALVKNIIPALAGIGFLFLSTKIFSFFRLLFSLFILPGTSLSNFGPKGSWALITGASDGIGKEFAHELAARGFNLFLVSRSKRKLDVLSHDLESHYSIQVHTLPMDFADNHDEDYAALKSYTADLAISILINNVGQSHSIPVPFVETDPREMTDIITTNCLATLRVTSLVAPGMVQRRRGLILTMASFGGVFPTPLLATYSGSKAFLQQWSTALGAELEPHGVRVQLVQAWLVASAMSKIRRTSLLVPSPRAFAKAALAMVGRSGGAQGIAYTSTPYWSHAMVHWAVATFVGTTRWVVVWYNRVMHEGIRRRALRKQEREAKKS